MKITIDNIINFMKNKQNLIITDKQEKEIKKHFYKDVEKLLLEWWNIFSIFVMTIRHEK